MAGCFNPKVFVNCLLDVILYKQLTKVFGLKCPATEYYQQLCVAHQVTLHYRYWVEMLKPLGYASYL